MLTKLPVTNLRRRPKAWPAPAALGPCRHCDLPVSRDAHGYLVHSQWLDRGFVGPATCAIATAGRVGGMHLAEVSS